jgi:hypothetical protein
MRYLLATVCFLLLLFTLPHAVIAQDDGTPPGWPIVERCVTPTVRPDGWTFEGTILLTGYAGIHGVNDAWSTPHVLVFLGSSTVPGGARLSPDGRWYAELGGKVFPSSTHNDYYDVEAIRVYSTVNGELYAFPWENDYLANWGRSQMYWLDNDHLVYEYSEDAIRKPGEILILNLSDGSVVSWEGHIKDVLFVGEVWQQGDSYFVSAQTPSPDLTRTVVSREYFHPTALYDTMNGEVLVEISPAYWPYISWTPDSSLFVIVIDTDPDEDRESRQLALLDRSGNFVDVVLTLSENQQISKKASTWSQDGRFLTLELDQRHQEDSLYIVDLEERQIIDTCLQTGAGAAFSPGNTQLAILERGEGTKYVMVLDLESWALHPVANHIVEYGEGVIGWRED